MNRFILSDTYTKNVMAFWFSRTLELIVNKILVKCLGNKEEIRKSYKIIEKKIMWFEKGLIFKAFLTVQKEIPTEIW